MEKLAEAGNVIASARTLNEIASGIANIGTAESNGRMFIELRHPQSGIVVRHNLAQTERDAVDDALSRQQAVFSNGNSGAVYVVAPIRTDETAFGFLGIVRDGPDGSGEDDRQLVNALATRTAAGVERVVSFLRDQELARMLQRSMLPLALPYSPGVRLDVAYEPAEREALVGGDWYDAFELPDGLIAVAIGDVAGHGFEAAIVMNQVRQSMRAAAMEDSDPATVLARVNRIVTKQQQPMVTALFGVLDPLALTFRFASAGHLPPLVVKESGEVLYLPCEGTPLGIAEDQVSKTCFADLSPGGALVLYTDGVVEDQRDFVRGEQALLEALARWAHSGFVLRASQLQTQLRTGGHADDAAMFVLRFPHVDDFEIRLPASPYNAQRMRLAAKRFMSGSPFDEDRAFDAVLVVGEAVNNAVEHAYADGRGHCTLSLRRETHRVVVEVSDEGTWREPAPVDRLHGLGIIERLADKLDVRTTNAGTAVRIEMAYVAARTPQPA
ncbi:MAG: SpoIIE family protein phosphatase [Candidatus Eremiobacteraeota bacterium]|nr:SpoIIE family protein phosphatase [Candidatus Eremiobacteraeota bacterium]